MAVLFALLFAEEKHATVEGKVSYLNGAAAAGVQVILQLEQCDCASCTDPAGCTCCPGLTLTLTSTEGWYTISVPAGTYSMKVKAQSGKPYREQGIELKQGVVVVRNIQLN
ncbi:MAG: carboxypeptidase regulatory-like domain-containing protein [Bacteroidetes bacterium]|nr:carboxypeptidase regulatory-like domain-containing protein [Bacteroidota bacterium]